MLKKLMLVSMLSLTSFLFAPIKDFDLLGSLCSGLTKALKDSVTPCGLKKPRSKCLSCCYARYGVATATVKEGVLQSKCPGMMETVCKATCPGL